MKLKVNTLAALDIGTSKICSLIAEMDEETQEPIIKGFGVAPSKGIKKGSVVNIEETTKSIIQAVSDAEKMSGYTISHCYVSITGDHIRSMNTRGAIAISRGSRTGLGEPREIEQEDIERVIEHTKSVPLPVDRQILHVIPQEFIIDEQTGIKSPINLSGRRLEAKVHLTTYSTIVTSNLSRCIKNAELEVERFVLQSLAASYSVLEEDEKELGTILIDIGSGTIDIIVYYDGGVHYTGVVNLGGFSVTNDIAYLLRIPLVKAESIKREHGCAITSLSDKGANFKIDGLGGRPPREISIDTLTEYIEPRMEEIFREAYLEARKADISLKNTLAIVLTGGGALLKGSEQLAENIFNSSARIGYPKGFQGATEEINNPSFSTSVGLLKFAIEERKSISTYQQTLKGPLPKLRTWIKNLSENVM